MFENFWEELFQIEPITGRTVNNINGIKIDGLSINVCIYIILGLIFLIAVFYDLYKNNKINWLEVGKKTLIAIFVFWILLEAKSSLNYFSYFSADSKNLAGRSLEEKRALIAPQGLYELSKLVKANTKPQDKVAIIVPPNNDYIDIMFNYFCAPYNRVPTTEAQYVVGCYVQPGNYKIIANTQYGWIAKQ